ETRVEYRIEQSFYHKKYVIIKFCGVDSISVGKTMKGGLLQVTREQLVPLPEDSYYIFDLMGLPVYTLEGEYLGEIADVLKTGANDVFVVEHEDGETVLIPALKQVVKAINFESRYVRVDPPKGLL
ncbi:MAG TPA: ribosome maturation factor RimM, partial [Clostridia bacterium]|nr:ribosome maturation factor RimM [Clostridia bacterium]